MGPEAQLGLDNDLRELTYLVPIGERSIEEHRLKLAQLVSPIKPDETVAKVQIFIPVAPNRKVSGFLYRLSQNVYEDKIPTVLHVPGTAFVGYETAYTDVACAYIVANTGCQVIVIHHRLAPEEIFPAQTDDVIRASAYLFENPKKFKIDLGRVISMGYSTGGTLITQLGAIAQQNGWRILLQILVSPILNFDRTSMTPFRKFEEKDTVISAKFVEWFSKLYIPDGVDRTNPKLSPLYLPEEDLEKMPRTSVIVGEWDRFRDDAERLVQILQKLGANNLASFFVCPEQNHGHFWNRLETLMLVAIQIKATIGFFSPKPNIDIVSSNGNEQVLKPKRQRTDNPKPPTQPSTSAKSLTPGS